MANFDLPANLDIDNHLELPALIKHGVRAGFLTTAGRETVRQIARLVDRARAQAIPHADLMIVLASAFQHDRADGIKPDWHPYQAALYDLTRSMCASPNGLRNTLLSPLAAGVTLEDHLVVTKQFIENERAKRAMPADVADNIIRDVVAELAPQYPDLGLSYGYIGNIWHAPFEDDRSFRIFTKLRNQHGHSVQFGDYHVDQLGELAFRVQAQLADWCEAQRALLQKGDYRSISMAYAA